jgi:hypothetical protein
MFTGKPCAKTPPDENTMAARARKPVAPAALHLEYLISYFPSVTEYQYQRITKVPFSTA